MAAAAKVLPQKFSTRFATTGNVAMVENWLTGNVRGKWSVKLESVSDDLEKKVYTLDFDRASDRALFRSRFAAAKSR
jgi:hypothetical protein